MPTMNPKNAGLYAAHALGLGDALPEQVRNEVADIKKKKQLDRVTDKLNGYGASARDLLGSSTMSMIR